MINRQTQPGFRFPHPRDNHQSIQPSADPPLRAGVAVSTPPTHRSDKRLSSGQYAGEHHQRSAKNTRDSNASRPANAMGNNDNHQRLKRISSGQRDGEQRQPPSNASRPANSPGNNTQEDTLSCRRRATSLRTDAHPTASRPADATGNNVSIYHQRLKRISSGRRDGKQANHLRLKRLSSGRCDEYYVPEI